MRFTKGNQPSNNQYNTLGDTYANFTGNTIFTGFTSICCATQHGELKTWIVDTGASDHMAYDLDLFVNLDALSKPVYITLPDGSLKTVTLGGNVQLDEKIMLRKVLYVPEFKFNLLSVTKLLADQNLCIHLYSNECIFQDLTTSQVVAVAQEYNGLYKLESQANNKHIKRSGLGRRIKATFSRFNKPEYEICST